jgi:hypothetical protein
MSPLDLRRAFEGANGSERRLLAIVVHPDDQELVREVWQRTPCAGEVVPR